MMMENKTELQKAADFVLGLDPHKWDNRAKQTDTKAYLYNLLNNTAETMKAFQVIAAFVKENEHLLKGLKEWNNQNNC